VLKAELPKRSHQVVENKGFPILALVEIGCRNCKLPKSGASLLSLARIDSAPATARASSQGDEHLNMKSATRPHSAVPSLARRERVDGVTCALHPRARHAGPVRAARVARAVVELPRAPKEDGEERRSVAIPPPSGEDALRLSSGWHAGRKSAERPSRQPPPLASERRDMAGSRNTKRSQIPQANAGV
jgi:hypothetical protein